MPAERVRCARARGFDGANVFARARRGMAMTRARGLRARSARARASVDVVPPRRARRDCVIAVTRRA